MSTHYVKTEYDLIRTVIVDDERLARDAIRMRLKDEPDVEVVGEAATGREAVKLIADALPDVVFLDVQMPGMDGFEVLDRVAPTWLPIVVFVTAYDRYALKAFETHALDYLLKPFTRDRFNAALDRARAAFANASEPSAQRGLVKLLNDRSGSDSDRGKGYLVRFAVRQHRGMRLVRVRDIDYIQAAGSVKVNTENMGPDGLRWDRAQRFVFVQVDSVSKIRLFC